MLLHLPNILSPAELQQARTWAGPDAPWVDGRRSAGPQAVQAKQNQQLAQGSPALHSLQTLVLAALQRHPLFFSAALPKTIFPPQVNRYGGESNFYGPHVDGAVLHVPTHPSGDAAQPASASASPRVRSDVSATLFLTEPTGYEGGELVMEDSFGEQRVKLPAGDLVLYPSSSVHRVEPITQGHRLASFFWVESMVRSTEQRRLLFELDMSLLRLRERHGETPETVRLTGTYHNLLRMWADT